MRTAVWSCIRPAGPPAERIRASDVRVGNLVARRPRLRIVLARTEPEPHLRFMETARQLGFREALAMTQFNLLGHFVALFGEQPHELQQSDWDEGRPPASGGGPPHPQWRRQGPVDLPGSDARKWTG